MRYVGALLILGGLALIGIEFWQWRGAEGDEPFRLMALADWWRSIDTPSLLQLAPAVERHVPGGPWLYENIIQPLLLWPASVELILLGVVIVVVSRIRL